MRTYLIKTPVSGFEGKVGVLEFKQGEALLDVPDVDPETGLIVTDDGKPTGQADDARLGTYAYVTSQGYEVIELDEDQNVITRDEDGEPVFDEDGRTLDDVSVRYRSPDAEVDEDAPAPLIGDPKGPDGGAASDLAPIVNVGSTTGDADADDKSSSAPRKSAAKSTSTTKTTEGGRK